MKKSKMAFRSGTFGAALVLGAAQAFAGAGAGAGDAAPPATVLTYKEGTNFSVAPSPDFKQLVIDFHGALWIMSADGGKAVPITDYQLEASRPTWSPRGDLIAFQAFRSGSYHIWTIRPDGTGLTQLTTGLSDNREPAWSPDGDSIAFASDRANEGSYDIWMVAPATKQLTRKTNAPAEEYEPVWSPDGGKIAFIDGETISAVDMKGVRSVAVAKPDGTPSLPAWAPDGKLAYLYAAPTGAEPGLSIGVGDGKPLVTGEDVFPFRPYFFPGNRMLYTADGGIKLRDLDSGTVKDIPFEINESMSRPAWKPKSYGFSDTTTRPVYGLTRPSMSPDGKTMLVNALADLYLVDASGKARQLTDNANWEANARWSADGKSVFYVSTKSGTPTLYKQAIDGGKPLPFGAAGMGLAAATPSPDESRIAVIDEKGVHVIDRASGQDRLLLKPGVQLAFGDQVEWSPDGRMLILSEKKRINHRYREGENLMRLIDTQTGAVKLIPPAPDRSLSTRAGGVGPVWSPDGRSLAFVMEARLHVLPVAPDGTPTGPAVAVTPSYADYPAWSADSSRLYYVGKGQIESVDVSSKQVQQHKLSLTYTPVIEKGDKIIHAGRFWDGKADAYRTDVDLVIKDDRIVAVKPHDAKRKKGVTYVDASQRVVMPGLIDMHVHPGWSDLRPWRSYLAMGITSIASMSSVLGENIQRREIIATGRLISPRLFANGESLEGTRANYPGNRFVYSDAQLDMEIARLVDANVDFLKTYVRLPAPYMAKAAVAAQKLGVATGSHFMWPGMESGQTMTTHITATTRVGYSATLSPAGKSYGDVIASYSQSGFGLTHTPFDRTEVARDPALLEDARVRALVTPIYGKALAELAKTKVTPVMTANAARGAGNIKRIANAGGIVAIGTDSPLVVPALGFQMEMRSLVHSGMTPAEVMRMSTGAGPRMMGADADLGTLEPGKLADLIIIDGDPMADINDLINVEKVMVGGHLFDQAMLQADLFEVDAP